MNVEYAFTLRYRLGDEERDIDGLIGRLADAGCDDALVGIGQAGRLGLEFTRKSPDARRAILSALADVHRAAPLIRLIEVAPDFVGLTDVAEIVGISRQAMRKLMLAHPTSFPIPVHEGSASIWHLADVLTWLKSRGHYKLDRGTIEVAKAALAINVAKEGIRMGTPRPDLPDALVR